MAYKLKIGPSQSLRLKGQIGFALPMVGGIGIATVKSGGIWTVSLDFSETQTGSTVNDDTAYILTWDSATGLYTRLTVTDLKAEIEGTFDGYYQPLDTTLTALAALDSTAGLLVQTGADTFERRTLTGTANEITVTNGDGTAGNPTLSLPASLTFTGKTVTGGAFQSPAITTPTGIVKGDVGLGNVDNTSDANKPVSTATQTALDGKQPLDAQLSDIAGITYAQGDILYFNGTNLARLSAGTSGQFLKTLGAAANPVWDSIPGGGDMLAAVYDPNNVAGDAFDINNMRGYVPMFVTKADAIAFNPVTSPGYIRFLSQTALSPSSGGEEWLGEKVAVAPSHDNYITITEGSIYERIPASPHSPASIAELGCSAGGSGFDNGVPFNKVLIAARESGFTDWFVPPGAYYFNTRTSGDIDFTGFTLRGSQNQKVTLYKNFESAGTNDAILNFRAQGATVSDMSLISLAGSQNASNIGTGSLISIVSDATYTAGYINLSRLVLSGDASLVGQASTYFPLVVDGSAKTTSPHGVRSVMLQDVLIFGGEIGSAKINGAVHFYWHGGECVLAGGKTGRLFVINDGSWGGVKSEDIRISLAYCDGLTMNNVNGANIDVARLGGNIEDYTGCTYCTVVGAQSSGTVVAAARSGTNRFIDYKTTSNEVTVSGSANVAVTPGTAISFGVTFAAAPKVTAMIIGANTYAYGSGVSTTGITLISASGTQLVHWTATGILA